MIRLETLGGLRVFADDEELRSLPGMQIRAALFVYLAVERETTREAVASLLWPDSAPKAARRALAQMLVELRKDLGADWVEASGGRLLVSDGVESDVRALVAAQERGDVDAVIDIHRGPFLNGVQLGRGVDFERWIESKRAELYRIARTALADRLAAGGSPSDRLRLARRWVEIDPLEDEAQHALIEALADSGDRVAALEAYRIYSELIWRDLELEPLEQTKALVARIKEGPKADDPLPPHGETRVGFTDDVPPHDSASSDHDLDIGVPDEFRVSRGLGRGITGSVYLAREPALMRLVAIKVLNPEVSEHPIAKARFEREAQSAARVLHPNTASVLRYGVTSDGRPFYVMPYIRGVTLADRIRARGPLSSTEVRRLLKEVASALAAAHALHVVHRDVRPANVLWEEGSGRTYLFDFGIAAVLESGGEELAKLTRTGELLGNPEYISPEQLERKKVDDRSDVYSLGVMGCELLSGNRPSEGVRPTPDTDDSELGELLNRAMATKPRHRPTAAELAEALAEDPRPPAPDSLLQKLVDRRMLPFVGGYLASGWLGMEAVDQLVQQDLLAPLAYRFALIAFIAGLNAALIISWFHGQRGRQRMPTSEKILLSFVFMGWVTAILALLL